MASANAEAWRQKNFRKIGIIFYLFVVASVCLAAVGIGFVATTHIPIWAILLFASVMTMNVPLGGLVGYVFFATGIDDDINTPPHVS